MIRNAGGGWRGHLPELPPGKWYVEIGTAQWRLIAPVRTPAPTGGTVLLAQPSERVVLGEA